MTVYDDKIDSTIWTGNSFVLPKFLPCDSVTFKASYIVVSNLQCTGKVTAFFDLVVLGNLEAAELDIKGNLVCLGICKVKGSITVQNEIWGNYIQANRIEAHDRIVVQEIDSNYVFSDSNILVGRILAIADFALSKKNVICGETIYGTGKVSANLVITGEPIDLDGGLEAVVAPYQYQPSVMEKIPAQTSQLMTFTGSELFSLTNEKFKENGDFDGYLDFLVGSSYENEQKNKFRRWKNILNKAMSIPQSGSESYFDISIILWLCEICNSVYFQNWHKILNIFQKHVDHFTDMVHRNNSEVVCNIESYGQLLEAFTILNRFASKFDNSIYNIIFEMVVSKLGMKAKFLTDRLNEKGWEVNGQ